ncbi:MAG: hypothetical protein OEW70_05620, partial [candidate division WOR-3 bacterium]|nr:hypothetical protein [candidate division WOR-3 bacterium]
LRRVRKVKISEVFIGGETISPESQAIVSLPDGGETMTGVVDTDEAKYPGTYFYDSIKKVRLFDETYRVADNKFFDLYEQAKSIIGFFVRGLKKLHTGLLTTYLGYIFLGGMLIFLAFLVMILSK